MACSVGDHIYHDYREAVNVWIASVKELNSAHSEALLERVEKNWLGVLLAKEAYENHVRKHRCERFGSGRSEPYPYLPDFW
jgi:hypothetical protein